MSDLVKQLRVSVGIDAINGDSFERSVCGKQMRQAADTIEQLQHRLGELEGELKESNDDLLGTQKSLSDAEAVIEEIQCSFCDEDACPLFEPFSVKNMWDWINSRTRLDKSRINELEESAFNYMKERDALAAHVDWINGSLQHLIDCGRIDERDFGCIIKKSPQTSLAEVRAQAVEGALKAVGKMENPDGSMLTYYEQLCDYANKIRNGKGGE